MNVEENKILKIRVGSNLYGTNTPTSDEDFSGVFFPDIQYVLGFKKIEEQDLSTVSKHENGKNTKDAVDFKLYEFRKFVQLGLENNPNIIEQFFVNKESILYIDKYGEELLGLKHLFLHKGIKQKFLGYAYSQRHKMIIKAENFDALETVSEVLKNVEPTKTFLEFYLTEITEEAKKEILVINDNKDNIKFLKIGDLHFDVTSTIKKVKEKILDRLSKVGNRKELITKYGFDTRFASHTIRLMMEGLELLRTGNLIFPLTYRELLLDIKKGKMELGKIIEISNELEKDFDIVTDESTLPSKPRYKEIETYTIETLKKFFKEKNQI